MAEIGQIFTFHPHIMPPPGARIFDLFQSHDGGAALAVGNNQVLGTYQVEQHYHGWLRKFAVIADDFAKVTLRLEINGTRVKYYESITLQLGDTSNPADIWVPLNNGAILKLLADVTSIAAVRWRMQGWVYSREYSEY